MFFFRSKSRSKDTAAAAPQNGASSGYAPQLSCLFPYSPEIKALRGSAFRGYDDELLIQSYIDKIEGYTLVTYDGLMVLANQVAYCETSGLEGDYVELGAYKGGCIAMMALCNMHYGTKRRRIHAFDSFEGIPQPAKEDMGPLFTSIFTVDPNANGELEASGHIVAGIEFMNEIVAKVNYPTSEIVVHKGWFQNTVPVAAPNIDKIAILRLDGDLYDSYKVPLEHLYDKVVPGGFIIIDDWIFDGCRQAVREFFTARGGMPFMHLADQTVRVIRKPS